MFNFEATGFEEAELSYRSFVTAAFESQSELASGVVATFGIDLDTTLGHLVNDVPCWLQPFDAEDLSLSMDISLHPLSTDEPRADPEQRDEPSEDDDPLSFDVISWNEQLNSYAIECGTGPRGTRTLAWLDGEFGVVIKPRGVTEIALEYEIERDTGLFNQRIESARGPLDSYVEVFARFGSDSVDASTLVSVPTAPRVKTRITTPARSGALLFRVLRRLPGRAEHGGSDPFFTRRLLKSERAISHLHDLVPRLDSNWSTRPDIEGKQVTILVHGTFSCGMKLASALFAPSGAIAAGPTEWQAVNEGRVLRYEHNTGQYISHHVKELWDLVGGVRDQGHPVLMIAHSRGGIVAAFAAQLAEGSVGGPPWRKRPGISLITFGTPFAGVGLLDGAPVINAIRTLLMAGARVGAKAIHFPPAAWGASVALNYVKIPVGVQEMHPGYIGMQLRSPLLSAIGDLELARSVGAELDIEAESAHGSFAYQFGAGWYSEAGAAGEGDGRSDGVVETESALCALTPLPPLANCDHSGYFKVLRSEILDRIENGPQAQWP